MPGASEGTTAPAESFHARGHAGQCAQRREGAVGKASAVSNDLAAGLMATRRSPVRGAGWHRRRFGHPERREESRHGEPRRSLASARDDNPASFRTGLAWSFGAATPPLSFRAAGEESPPLATPRSLASARDDKPASFHPGLTSSFRAATPLLSFRAEGEESRHRAARRSLAFARDDDGESFQVQGEESRRFAARRSLSLARDDRGESFRAQGGDSRPLQRRDPSRCSG
jgi:hypothetical protein